MLEVFVFQTYVFAGVMKAVLGRLRHVSELQWIQHYIIVISSSMIHVHDVQ